MSRLLYRTEGILVPETTRSHLEFRLFLDQAWPRLDVRFRYGPKHLEHPDHGPLSNLLTLSFDDRDGFRGAAHRHPNDLVLTLGPEASPGLVPGPIPRGILRVTLSVHAVLTPTCRYELEIVAPEAL